MSTSQLLVDSVLQLISLPEIYLRLQQTIDDPLHSREQIAEIIAYDPALSARVLREWRLVIDQKLAQERQQRLQAHLRGDDTVARLGGDEFIIILSGLSQSGREAASHAREIANKIRDTIGMECRIDDSELHVTASIGISMISEDETSGHDLLRYADTAMYEAKREGRNRLEFFSESMSSDVTRQLERINVPSESIIMEVTEHNIIHNLDDAIQRMQELINRGISFSLDDFGTGYSSLAHLKNLPVNHIKIDRSFVKDICKDVGDQAMVASILALSKHLGLEVVAEGVEDLAQFHLLKQYGCKIYQGYFFSEPLSAANMTDYLVAKKPGA